MSADLVIVGGGVMGLFCAYHASERGARVVVLERGRIGDPMTASFGRTRSYRSDYLDPTYARLAREAYRLWGTFEARTGADVLVRCGCMNIVKRSVTPDLETTYAHLSHRVLRELGLPTAAYDGRALRERYPFLDADLARIDLDGGVVNLPAVTAALLRILQERGVRILEGTEVRMAVRDGELIHVVDHGAGHTTRSLVITAGHGTNEVLARLEGARLHVPLTRDRPIEARYFAPPPETREQFTAAAMPVIAYLDAGIYCHPIVEGLSDKLKIGYYHPPDLPRTQTAIDSVGTFVEHCMPGLRDAESTPVSDTDGCDYDLVADDEFVLGPVPGFPGAHVGVGWRGTGYKFAPWTGLVLAELALQRGTVYDIARFDPARFEEGGADGTSVTAHPAAAPR
ncbi:MAG: FAD-dependent oxidoreductase [Solirubrobacterales bacterium]|nr:FAD-dependent oxidoreductase [Solirubrobacterales bacterium]